MTWLKDILVKLLEVINGLPVKAKCFYVGAFIFLFGGYFFYTQYLDYKIELAGIQQSQPSLAPKTEKNNKQVQMAGMIDRDEIKQTAQGSSTTK